VDIVFLCSIHRSGRSCLHTGASVTPLPPRVPIWVCIYVLYQSSELRAERWSTVLTGRFAHRSGHDLGVCNMLLSLALARSRACWAVRRRIATCNERPGKRSLCSTLHGDGCRSNFFFQFAALELDLVVFPRYFQTSAGKDSSHRSSGRLNHPAELIKSKS